MGENGRTSVRMGEQKQSQMGEQDMFCNAWFENATIVRGKEAVQNAQHSY